MAKAVGRVIQIQGSVVDVEFPEGELPDVFEALEIPRENGGTLVLEVEKHLGKDQVRCVSMDTTDGLQRGLPVTATGAPIMVPVGAATLGRIFNVLGLPVDEKRVRYRPGSATPFIVRHRSFPNNPPAPRFSKPASRSLT